MVVNVEPIGTITRDFPFLEDEDRSKTESIMRESMNCFYFTSLLAEKVCAAKSPPTLIFLALLHAQNVRNNEAVDMIAGVHSQVPLAIPFFLPLTSEKYDLLVKAVDDAIESNPNYVVVFFLLMKLYFASAVGSREEARVQKLIEDLLEGNELLKPHSGDYFAHYGERLRIEGNPEEAFSYQSRALEIAKESDDKFLQSAVFFNLAEIAGQYTADPDSYSKAREYLGESQKIAELLNNQMGVAGILQNISVFSAGRGEYNEAIECQLESVRIKETLGEVDGGDAWNLSGQYASVGDGHNALEWARVLQE
ncbi:MAG: tetratricopeptide repeat protein, partial [Candidatus Thorarchaeota archaeon]